MRRLWLLRHHRQVLQVRHQLPLQPSLLPVHRWLQKLRRCLLMLWLLQISLQV